MVETVADMIEALGGTARVAALASVGPSAVSNWRSRGRVPAELFLVFSDALRAVGVQANPALFGMAPTAGAEA